MALVKCPECGNEISDTAASCPKCGYGIKKSTVTVEATGKKWKALQFLGPLAVIFGIIMLIIALATMNGEPIIGVILLVLSIILIVGGIIASFIGRIGAWWYHG